MAVLASRMSLAPKADLGVVASTQVIEQVTEPAASDLPTADLPLTVESVDSLDVPSLDTVSSQPAAEQSAGDLPAIEPEAGTTEEIAGNGDGS